MIKDIGPPTTIRVVTWHHKAMKTTDIKCKTRSEAMRMRKSFMKQTNVAYVQVAEAS